MKLILKKPELERYVDEQVRSGNFPTPEAVVEDALMAVIAGQYELTDEDWAAIEKSREQIKRGECVDFDVFVTRFRNKYGIPTP